MKFARTQSAAAVLFFTHFKSNRSRGEKQPDLAG